MTWSRSLSLGFGLTFAGLILVLLAAFTYNFDFEVPLVFSLSSATSPKPHISLDFNPLGLLSVALLISVFLRYAARLIAKTKKNVHRAP